MSEYGITETGFNKQRLDVILNRMQDDLQAKLGFDPRANPKSYLNVLLTDVADKIAELWEVADQVYQSLSPSTAEDESLDRVAQYGGCYREKPQQSRYTILCTGDNGTVLPAGTTRIATDTSPAVILVNHEDGKISTDECTAFEMEISGDGSDAYTYQIKIGEYDTIRSLNGDILQSLQTQLSAMRTAQNEPVLTAVCEDNKMRVEFAEHKAHEVIFTEGLKVSSVTSPVYFYTEEYGNITIPEGIVKNITATVPGLHSVYNLPDYIHGRDRETDTELRRSYLDKIFIRSRTMLESITSAILQNVTGVESVRAYQNDTELWRGVTEDDAFARMPPHSVTCIVAGGDDEEIAKQIFATKAAGIQTCHHCGYFVKDGAEIAPKVIGTEAYMDSCVEIDVPDDYGNPVTVRFSRPMPVYFDVYVYASPNASEMPGLDTIDHIRRVIMDNINALPPGENIQPQKWIHKLYEEIPGVGNYEITLTDITTVDPVTGLPIHANWDLRSFGITYSETARIRSGTDITVEFLDEG